MSVLKVVKGIANILSGGIVDEITDLIGGVKEAVSGELSPEKKAELMMKIKMLELKWQEFQTKIKEYQANIIMAEATGHSWIQRNWRPLVMLLFASIIANNYIFYPYITLFGGKAVQLNLDENIWALLKIGIGGYITGRTVEKTVSIFKGTSK